MNIDPEKPITSALEQRCEVRLTNDAAALEALSCERMQVVVRRFGRRVVAVQLLFPKVRTALKNRSRAQVVVREVRVRAFVRPNSSNLFPYPLGNPEVRIEFPSLSPGAGVPWLGGLAWIDSAEADGPLEALVWSLPPPAAGKEPFGIPCLWRQGGWTPECDLVFVAGQIHRMLTDPGDYSPSDAMNPEAALYWATHRDELPFEPPMREFCEPGAGSGRRPATSRGFALVAVE